MKEELIKKLATLKKKYAKEGFYIVGVFGSYARGEETPQSDVDILYELDEKFITAFDGFEAFSRLEEIRRELSRNLNRPVDIAAKSGLGKTARKHILRDLQNV